MLRRCSPWTPRGLVLPGAKVMPSAPATPSTSGRNQSTRRGWDFEVFGGRGANDSQPKDPWVAVRGPMELRKARNFSVTHTSRSRSSVMLRRVTSSSTRFERSRANSASLTGTGSHTLIGLPYCARRSFRCSARDLTNSAWAALDSSRRNSISRA